MKALSRLATVGCCLLALVTITPAAHGFGFIFAGESNGVDVVTHPAGYTGTGGVLNVTVGIDPTSVFIPQMTPAVLNVIATWNALIPTTGNIKSGVISGVDFESVLLHEMGHSLGLSHPNLSSESGLGSSQQNGTKSTNGVDNVFNISAGPDGKFGSADDIRGDDVNLNYFRIADNDPFATNLGVVDKTTYSRDIALLPAGDNYSANADRSVGAALGYASTEAVMQQGTFFGETQRSLGADDVAGIRYAQAGKDELQGTADDYTLNLIFAGNTTSADIVIDFDASQTSFAVSSSNGAFLSGSDHVRITSSDIFFDPTDSWFFNTYLGDLDGDFDVDNADIGIAVGNFTGANGSTTMTRAQGDVDGDGDVDNSDIGLIVGQFTGALSLASNLGEPQIFYEEDHEQLVGTIPEPASAALLSLGLSLILTRRRRR